MKGQTVRVSAFIILYFIYWTVSSWQALRSENDGVGRGGEIPSHHWGHSTPSPHWTDLFKLSVRVWPTKKDCFHSDNIMIFWSNIKYPSFSTNTFHKKQSLFLSQVSNINIRDLCGSVLASAFVFKSKKLLRRRFNFVLNVWQATKIIFSP